MPKRVMPHAIAEATKTKGAPINQSITHTQTHAVKRSRHMKPVLPGDLEYRELALEANRDYRLRDSAQCLAVSSVLKHLGRERSGMLGIWEATACIPFGIFWHDMQVCGFVHLLHRRCGAF